MRPGEKGLTFQNIEEWPECPLKGNKEKMDQALQCGTMAAVRVAGWAEARKVGVRKCRSQPAGVMGYRMAGYSPWQAGWASRLREKLKTLLGMSCVSHTPSPLYPA